ncbi:MAG TPA: hypothetical protein VLK82_16835, partial [Candidatus Tectomicrobia bacterium]|nr:hypothetical protein [Candidatus Tectomicrobia bacterium]
MVDRRRFLKSSLVASLFPLIKGCYQSTPWERAAYRKSNHSRVAILPATSYDMPLKNVVLDGIKLFGLQVHGKTVVLKPNLV